MMAHRFFGEGEIAPLPRPELPAPSATAFVLCPVPMMMGAEGPWCWANELYRIAYEQARAAVSPPWHLRMLLACPN